MEFEYRLTKNFVLKYKASIYSEIQIYFSLHRISHVDRKKYQK